jgi:acid phosphatase type 7
MEKRSIISRFLIVVSVLFLFQVQAAAEANNKELPKVLTPYLQNPTADGMTVCFLAQGAEDVYLQWGAEGASTLKQASGKGVAIAGTPWTIWKIRIANLKAGSTYKYQVKCRLAAKDTVTATYRFKSLNPCSKTLKVALFNDIHNNDNTLAALMKYVNPSDFECSVLMGDCLADPSAENGGFNVFRTLNAFVRLLDGASKPIVFVRGNHETRNSFSHQLALLFDLPNLTNEQSWAEQQWQFTLRAGPLFFIAMDAGEDEDGLDRPECRYKQPEFWKGVRQREAGWLKNTIAVNPGKNAPWRVFISHIPLYNDNEWYSKSSRGYWESLLSGANLDLMLAGHDHAWKLLPKDNKKKQQWPVLIGGGPSLEEGTVMLLSADKRKLTIRLLGAKDGRLLTEFKADKNKERTKQ